MAEIGMGLEHEDKQPDGTPKQKIKHQQTWSQLNRAGWFCTACHRAIGATGGCRSGQTLTVLHQVSTAVHRAGQFILKW